VRDLLLGREVTDVDLVVEGDPRRAARALSAAVGGAPFPLSERHGAWRVVQGPRTVDIAACRGTIEEDLALRDFTVNAMAMRIEGGELRDPFAGRRDLERRLLRLVSERVFVDDPLRLLRLGRIAHELGFAIDPEAATIARRQATRAAGTAGERIYMEVRRLLALRDPAAGLRLLERLGTLDVILPELVPLRGVAQSPFHHLDVFEHTLAVVDATADVADHPGHYLPRSAPALEEALARPLGDGLLSRQALRLAALFHDIRKPQTRELLPDGRVSFMGHDREGAAAAAAILRRWRAANAVARFCRALVGEHLRLGFLIRERPLDRRAAHRYARATGPYALESVVLSLADRLATRGPLARQRQLRAHAETAEELVDLLLELEREPSEPLLRGDEIARIAGARGARIRRLVEALAEEQAAGTVRTREEAVDFVRR
jgi:poly(A) polymerase